MQDPTKPISNKSTMRVIIHIKNNTCRIIIVPSDVPVSRNSRSRTRKVNYNALNRIFYGTKREQSPKSSFYLIYIKLNMGYIFFIR